MLEKSPSKRDAITISTMLESKLICYEHYIAWADERIILEDEPELWLLELAVTRDSEAAIRLINTYVYSEPFEEFDYESCNDEYVASLWLLYKRNDISWAKFLLECGDYTDGNYARKDCEFFYYMLNDFEASDYSKSLEKLQQDKVNESFKDVIDKVFKIYSEFSIYKFKYRDAYKA